MTTYNTGNPIGSTDARDRADNSENMDILENSTTLDSHPDRRGVLRKTRKGMELEHDNQISAHEVEHDAQMQSFENDFDGRLAGMAFTRVGTFTTGATLTDMRQTLLWEVSQGGDGREYGWTGSFLPAGKVVSPGSTPTPVSDGNWVDRTDNRLRSDLNIVVKTFDSVISMKSDTTLIPGMIVETLSYRDGWAVTTNGPTGGNKYEIVSANTGVDDGGLFVNLSASGLQAKGLFENGIYNVNQWGCYNNGINVDTSFLLNAIAAGKPLQWSGGDYLIDGTLTGIAAWSGVGSGLAYSSDSSTKWTTIRLSGANSGVAFLNPPSNFTGFHIDGQNQLGVGLSLGVDGSFVGFRNWKDIKVRRCLVGIDCYNYYSSSFTDVAVQGNVRGVRMTPSDTAADDGYWTSTNWENVHIADNTEYGIYAYAPQGTRTFTWENVVIERNGASGSQQCYMRNISVVCNGAYFEGSPSKPAITSNASKIKITGGTFNGTGGIDATANNIELDFDSVHMSSATDVVSNLTTNSNLSFRNSTIQTDITQSGKNLQVHNCLIAGIQRDEMVRSLKVGKNNTDGIQPSILTNIFSYQKTVSATINANSNTNLITNQYHYGLFSGDFAVGQAQLVGYHPGLILVVTPSNVGTPHYFCVNAINTTTSQITVTSEVLNVIFTKTSGISL